MLEFGRTFVAPSGWDDAARSVAQVFWQHRHFAITRLDASGLAGRRGTLLGNLTSFDMRRVLATVNVSASGDSVSARVLVDPRLQMITDWDRAFFRLELVEFQSLMQTGSGLQPVWADYQAAGKSAALWSAVTLGLAGAALSPEWAARIGRLESTKMFGPSGRPAGP